MWRMRRGFRVKLVCDERERERERMEFLMEG